MSPIASKHDLDNLKLLPGESCNAYFRLKNILVQGHARDVKTNAPPRGLQFVLGSTESALEDTITMANLGYLQLKANPGLPEFRIRAGRSQQVYEISSISVSRGSVFKTSSGSYQIPVDSFEGATIFPMVCVYVGQLFQVRRRKGMEEADVLANQDEELTSDHSWFSQLKNVLGMNDRPSEDQNTSSESAYINIFSVASGHLYERFMSIMILSVMKNTNSTVKFWLIEDFLSPSFKDFVPLLAKEYGFRFQFVTYKWPHWLREQSEKQRTIWGYKVFSLKD